MAPFFVAGMTYRSSVSPPLYPSKISCPQRARDPVFCVRGRKAQPFPQRASSAPPAVGRIQLPHQRVVLFLQPPVLPRQRVVLAAQPCKRGCRAQSALSRRRHRLRTREQFQRRLVQERRVPLVPPQPVHLSRHFNNNSVSIPERIGLIRSYHSEHPC